jgi:hypothetical protein
MTTKEKILGVINSLDDNVSIEQAIDRLYLLHKSKLESNKRMRAMSWNMRSL